MEVIEAMKRTTGNDFPVRLADRRPEDVAEVVANSDLMKSYGWQPRYDDLEFILRTALDWERKSNEAMS